MSRSRVFDGRGCAISGAVHAALTAYERALGAFMGWRGGTDAALAIALQHAPRFVMAHLLQAYQLVCSRDPRSVRSAQPVLARAAALPANPRERQHVAALAAVLDDDYELAKSRLGELLAAHPRDVLALHAAHALDYITGDTLRLRDRVAAVLPKWSSDLPGHGAVLAMHAFGLVECGEPERAEQTARAVLATDPHNPRAHHVMAHVFETGARAGAGVRWMNEHAGAWGTDSGAATHCAWHLALFHLARGEGAGALALYDQRVRAGRSGQIGDLIDATALLWRVRLHGADTGARWPELCNAWEAHIDDRFCSFTDLHAMLAFVGAGDWERAHRLERALASEQSLPTRHALTTRQLGLPACRALIAFGRGQYTLAVPLLASLPALAHRLGGSHPQRDVLHLTLQQAIGCLRRPARRRRGVVPAVAPPLAASAPTGATEPLPLTLPSETPCCPG